MTDNPLEEIDVERFENNPLITSISDNRIGSNINGPSVIQAPDWLNKPLGEYYMYFGNHNGEYIRLAYSDNIHGPWKVYTPGTLDKSETKFEGHIASPDAHVNDCAEEIRLYFHGCCGPFNHRNSRFDQATSVAVSSDGLNFTSHKKTLGNSYFRVWEYEDMYYAIANDGYLYMSEE